MAYPKFYDDSGEMTPDRAVELFGAQVIGEHGIREWWIKELRQRNLIDDEYSIAVRVLDADGMGMPGMRVACVLNRGGNPRIFVNTDLHGLATFNLNGDWIYSVGGPTSQGPATIMLADVPCEGYDSAGLVFLTKHTRRCLDVTISNEAKEPVEPPIEPPVEPPVEPPIDWFQVLLDRLDRIIALLQ